MKSGLVPHLFATVLLSALALNAGAESSLPKIQKNLKRDLNGDGKADTIRLQTGKDNNKYQLTINGSTVSGALLFEVEGFYIANINRSDKYYEVVVYTPGASDDNEHVVYCYDGKQIRRIAHLERWVDYKGDGTLTVTSWAGFWQPKDKWTLTRSHQLIKQPRTYYPVNIKATTTMATPLRASIGGTKVSTIPMKTSVVIVKSNPQISWYYIKAGSKAGWITEAELYERLTGMPVAD